MMKVNPGEFYIAHAGHYVITDKLEAPPRAGDDESYLYLAVFPAELKIGITKNVYSRLRQHEQLTGTQIEGCYLILLDHTEAKRREAKVARYCGGVADSGHKREWFGREHLEIASLLMRKPHFAETLFELRLHNASIGERGFDVRFSARLPWLVQAVKAEAA